MRKNLASSNLRNCENVDFTYPEPASSPPVILIADNRQQTSIDTTQYLFANHILPSTTLLLKRTDVILPQQSDDQLRGSDHSAITTSEPRISTTDRTLPTLAKLESLSSRTQDSHSTRTSEPRTSRINTPANHPRCSRSNTSTPPAITRMNQATTVAIAMEEKPLKGLDTFLLTSQVANIPSMHIGTSDDQRISQRNSTDSFPSSSSAFTLRRQTHGVAAENSTNIGAQVRLLNSDPTFKQTVLNPSVTAFVAAVVVASNNATVQQQQLAASSRFHPPTLSPIPNTASTVTNCTPQQMAAQMEQSRGGELMAQLLAQQQQHQMNNVSQVFGDQAFSGDTGTLATSQLCPPTELVNLPAATLIKRLNAGILRSPLSVPNRSLEALAMQSKPIPHSNERMDLLRFRLKEPKQWTSDDVVAWLLAVARAYQIPCENFSLHKFAGIGGALLSVMIEEDFKSLDHCYGSLLYSEFQKLVSDSGAIDEWIRSYLAVGLTTLRSSSTNEDSAGAPATRARSGSLNALSTIQTLQRRQEDLQASQSNQQQLHEIVVAAAKKNLQKSSQSNQQAESQAASLGSAAIGAAQLLKQGPTQRPEVMPFMHGPHHQAFLIPQASSNASGLEKLANAQLLFPSTLPSAAQQQAASERAGAQSSPSSTTALQRVSLKLKGIRKNKDGRLRKRSQHTKGNKLWEFIRDALKNPITCPSVVRWEDPVEGVFRIVESEKLARLWGDKKRNVKMTYEKLSRAMRTYYEKEILVPVPKTGLYPKKLVYKFGPGAQGWASTACIPIPQPPITLLPTTSIPMPSPSMNIPAGVPSSMRWMSDDMSSRLI